VGAENAGVIPETALIHRVAVNTEGINVKGRILNPGDVKFDGKYFRSDTGELLWDLTEEKRGVVTVNSPLCKAVIGFSAGKKYELGDITIEPGNTMQDGWSAITVARVNGKKFLVTATGYCENTGMLWKDGKKESVGRNWGKAPSLVEGIPAEITFKGRQVKMWALDENGKRRQESPDFKGDRKSVV
jgi:hypothetical protein